MVKKEKKVPKFIGISHSRVSLKDEGIQELLKNIDIIDEIDYRGKKYPIVKSKGMEISDEDKINAISAMRAEETLKHIYRKLDAEERKLIDERYNISRKYFNDALKCKSDKSRMVLFTIACEIIYEIIARIIVKSIKSTTNLHKKFRRSHAIKLRFGFDELKPLGECIFGAKIKLKNADYKIGKTNLSEKEFFKALQNKEKFDEGFFSDWVFKHGRYIISKKFDEHLSQKHNVELFASYLHLEVIFLQLREGKKEFFLGGLKEDEFIGIPCLFAKIKVSDKKSVSLKEFYREKK